MLTAEGTLPNARAAAENEPDSTTARNNSTLSLEKLIRNLSKKLKASDFLCQP
jgi:hypothetical protein